MTSDDRIRRADELFVRIFRDFRLFHYLNPTNHQVERDQFMESYEEGSSYQPLYEYNPLPAALTEWKTELHALEFGNSPLELVYEKTRQEYELMLRLAEAHGTSKVTQYSRQLFGQPSPGLIEEAQEISQNGPPQEADPATVGVKSLLEKIRSRLQKDRIEGWDVVEDPGCVALAEVDRGQHRIRLQSGLIVAEEIVPRLLCHLIEGHVYRTVNGERQPYKAFAFGLNNHMATEEGLAVLLEDRAGLLSPSLYRRYAGRAFAVSLAAGRSFFDIFQELVESFPPEVAYVLTERSKRGMSQTSEPGGFFFDHVYLQEKKVVEKLSPEKLRMLYTGKISSEHLPLVTQMLEDKKIIEPAFLPSAFHG